VTYDEHAQSSCWKDGSSLVAGERPEAGGRVLLGHPDPAVAADRVSFGTSGHRGSAFERTFNEAHILAITQAICLYRLAHGIDGPLFMGRDTHALSEPAFVSALEVLAANGVEVMIHRDRGYTPTPAISHAIFRYNRPRRSGLADGIVVTPSRNPPEDGGYKYKPPAGGPADTAVTGWIERIANALLAEDLQGVRRVPGLVVPERPTPSTTSRLMWTISRASSTWRRSAAAACASAWIRSAAPACSTGSRSSRDMASTSPWSTTRSIRRSGS
jgi:hypothetical protein